MLALFEYFFDVLAIFYHQKASTLAIFGYFLRSSKRCTIALICIMQCTLAMFQYFFMFLHYFISSRGTIALICSALLQKFDICLCSCNILSAEDSQLHRYDLEYFDISCNISIISYNVFCTRHTFTIFQYF